MTPLEKVPDPVFADKMVGDGVSIDPIDSVLVAPVAGEIAFIHPSRHALTVKTADGLEVLLHIGLDTVSMRGEGFVTLVEVGDQVEVGDRLIEFDQDKIIGNAMSLLTQMVISNMELVESISPATGMVTAGDSIAMTLQGNWQQASSSEVSHAKASVTSDPVTVVSASGLHARPAALLVGMAKEHAADLTLIKGGDTANAKSLLAVMSLGAAFGDQIQVSGSGPAAASAVSELVTAIAEGLGEGDANAQAASVVSATTAPMAPARAAESVEPIDPNLITGVAASPGVAAGVVFWLSAPEIIVTKRAASDPAVETAALEQALATAKSDLAVIEEKVRFEAGAMKAEIFGAHRELLDDPELTGEARTKIANGDSAAYAWQTSYRQQADRLAAVDNALLAARAIDIRDVGLRVLQVLTGEQPKPVEFPDSAVIVASDLTPSQTAGLDRSKVAGIATVEGGKTSHAAILAQSMGIPAVAGAESRLLDVAEGTNVVVDGDRGEIQLNLSDAELAEVQRKQQERLAVNAENLKHAGEPAQTKDGRRIEVVANIGGADECEAALANGAEGVGLLRSEFVFLQRATAPSEAEQAELYAKIAGEFTPEQKLVVRTLDVGGDKPLPYLPLPPEENPFLGVRGIRIGLNRLDIMQPQLRAILGAAGKGADVHLMFPMISTLEEFRAAKDLVEAERVALGAPRIPIGLMVEVPTVAMMAEQFAKEADFFSIGTNDLTQYTLAMDRGHAQLAAQVDALNPGVLALIKQTVDGAHEHGKWVGICGGLASDPGATAILVGLGVDELSAVIPAVPNIKAAVRELTLSECESLAAEALTKDTSTDVRDLVAATTQRKDG